LDKDYTVVLAVKNAANYLGLALDSVYSQTLPPKEVIVVDDNSLDETISIASKYLAKVIKNEGIGQAAGLNTGIKNCTTELISFLDHDDIWRKDKQEIQVNLMFSDSKLDYVVSEVVNHDGTGVEKNMGLSRVLGACTFRTDFVLEMGKFNEELNHHAIVEWWSRPRAVEANWKGVSLPQFYRLIHGNNTTTLSRDEAKQSLLQAVRMGIQARQR